MGAIQKDKVAVINYTLRTGAGQIIDQGDQLAYLHGHNNLLSGMEQALEGKGIGDKINTELAPEHAFGHRSAVEPIQVPRSHFGENAHRLYKGLGIQSTDEQGVDTVLYVETLTEQDAFLSSNHPLAGETLNFEANIVNVRQALREEIEQNMAFGPDGDQKPSSCACC